MVTLPDAWARCTLVPVPTLAFRLVSTAGHTARLLEVCASPALAPSQNPLGGSEGNRCTGSQGFIDQADLVNAAPDHIIAADINRA